MNDTLGPEYYSTLDSGLIGYWRFDELEDLGISEDSTDDVRDYSVHENHGDLKGDAHLAASEVFTGINEFYLNQNYPNPFNPSTMIGYRLKISNKISLKIYDVRGSKIRTLVNQKQPAGQHSVTFDASGLASGIYFYRL